ncbi:unnamed protein product [Owenia fusiformis]|uniref:Uncharacterized protein n=1 Tax=Owenia fusiformis TaxID=6347 RepID=A0A8S4PMX7_OWEFU|nr:unnamed protein product [Owenia fusiformis]
MNHHVNAGRKQSEMLAMAKYALEFFNIQFGIDVDNVSDAKVIAGEPVTDEAQGLIFAPGILPKRGKLRLDVAISADGSKRYKEAYISDAGWSVTAIKPFTCAGRFKGILKPGWSVVYGDYVINCDDHSDPLVISYKSKCPIGNVELSTSGDTFSYRVELFSELFGRGVGQVTCTDVPPKTFTTAVMTFPPILHID